MTVRIKEQGVEEPRPARKSKLTDEDIEIIRKATSDADLFTKATFMIRIEYLEKLRKCSYTYSTPISRILDAALREYLDRIDDSTLQEIPDDKPKRGRPKKEEAVDVDTT